MLLGIRVLTRDAKESMATKKASRHVTRATIDRDFETHVTETLHAQDKMLEKLDKRLDDAHILNGGYDGVVENLEKIKLVQGELKASVINLQETASSTVTKLNEIHTAIYDPEKGLYAKVKDSIRWINNANWVIKGSLGLGAASGLAAFGKIVYDMITGHVHLIH